ncbi:hypothetical protein [Mycobacteroides abscessus]|uniref:hypothetical protein n=1 Tax=Mycobacteroides abscessus TaxID=36809 RepID=UPI0009A61346|nr:hypothetical protein [Mycobacteroides abscessus]SLH39712.1 Uncharacterised protein [Mycobacteroides abscessus subsp. massiliense]
MSAVIFATRDATSTVAGTERARGAYLAGRIAAHGLGLNTLEGMERARRILPDEFFGFVLLKRSDSESISEVEAFARWAPVAAMMGAAAVRVVPGPELNLAESLANARTQGLMETVLNTAIFRGTNAQVLLARIDGSAEDGIFITEQDRPWLAGIISDGASLPGALHGRHDQWDVVARHLQDIDANPGPALLLCSQGRSLHELGAQENGIFDIKDAQERDRAWDAFSGLLDTTVWDQCIDAITGSRADKPWLRLSPKTFRERNYGDGFTAQDAVAAADAWWYRKLGIQV